MNEGKDKNNIHLALDKLLGAGLFMVEIFICRSTGGLCQQRSSRSHLKSNFQTYVS